MIRIGTFVFVITACTFVNADFPGEIQECSNSSLFILEAFAHIYDNQTKGDVVYEYLDVFKNSLHFKNPCNGIRLDGNKVILDMTRAELEDKCDIPKGACEIFCGTVRGSLHRIRETLDLRGPEFNKDTYQLDITENSLNASVVFSFGEDDIIRNDCFHPEDKTFDLQHLKGRAAFGITYPGRIFLTRQLDYENGDRQFVLNITLNNRNRFATTTVKVNVIDVDDMDPEFDHDNYLLRVQENDNITLSKWQKTIPEISAHDKDYGTGKQDIAFTHYNDSDKRIFDINETTGEIKITTILNREDTSRFEFKIKVYQKNDARRSATANLIIMVTDQNDNKPIFDKSEYNVAIDEHSSDGTIVLQVHATDKDMGEFSKVKYSIVGNQEQFKIDSDTGVITVANHISLDADNSTNPLFLRIQATDFHKQEFIDTAVVKVTINDKNDNSPIFTQHGYHFNVSKIGVFGKVIARDLDKNENGAVEYSLETAPVGVTINKTSGIITTNVPLSSGTELRVKACDSSGIVTNRRCSFTNVVITSAPIKATHTNMSVSVKENMTIGSFVDEVMVTGTGYEIIETNVPFSVDSRGIIRTTEVFDYDDGLQLYNFNINVLSTSKSILANIQVTVNIEDVNDNVPQFQNSSYSFVLPDDLSADIGTIKATDKDSSMNGNITYLLKTTMDSIGFTCTKKSGVIRASDGIDSSKYTYLLYIKAIDGGDPKLSTFTEVLITRVKEVRSEVKFGTPLEVETIQDRKEEFERGIGSVLHVECRIEDSIATKKQMQTRSFIVLSGKFNNGSRVPVENLRILILDHMTEIQGLFGHNNTVYTPIDTSSGIGVPVIALIVLAGVIFIGSVVLIIVLRTQWITYKRQFKFDRLNDHLTRKSSLYESQEMKVKMDDETSDYSGSLHTQDIETSRSSKGSTLDATAFSNPVYQTVHGRTTLVISPSTAAAANEALESLQDLAERLNIEDTNANMDGNNSSEQTYVKEAEETRVITSIETYDDVDIITPEIIENEPHMTEPYTTSTNLMKFESDQSLHNQNEIDEEVMDDHIIQTTKEHHLSGTDSVFEEQKHGLESELETCEPDIDYNDKQVRFSSIVLDTEDDVFKPLKEETITPAQFEYDSEYDDRDMESLASSFPDLYKLVKHDSSETDRADEEINSPIDFFKADVIKRTPTDHGTFHFSLTEAEADEITEF